MKVDRSRINDTQKVTITGSVKTIDETREIRAVLDDILAENSEAKIEVHLKETDVITSSLIGIFVKLIYVENAKIAILTDSEKLYKLIERLNLVDTLRITKI